MQQLWKILECINEKVVAIQHYKSNNKDTFLKKNSRNGSENNTKSSCQRKTQQGKDWSAHNLRVLIKEKWCEEFLRVNADYTTAVGNGVVRLLAG